MVKNELSVHSLAIIMKDKKKGTPETGSFSLFQTHILTRFFMLSFVTKSIFLALAISSVLFYRTPLRDAMDVLY